MNKVKSSWWFNKLFQVFPVGAKPFYQGIIIHVKSSMHWLVFAAVAEIENFVKKIRITCLYIISKLTEEGGI